MKLLPVEVQNPTKTRHENINKSSERCYSGNDSVLKGSGIATREPIFIFSQLKNVKNEEEKKKFKHLLEELRNKLPEGFNIGAAVGNGDSFFDTIAQGLNELKDKDQITDGERISVNTLRENCKQYAKQVNQSKEESWLHNALKREGEKLCDYISRIKFTAEDIEFLNLSTIIWGRPEVEGIIICERYGVKMRIISLKGDDIDGLHVTKSKLGIGNNVIYTVNYRGHFVPLLSNIKKDIKRSTNVSREEVYSNVIGSHSNDISTPLHETGSLSYKQRSDPKSLGDENRETDVRSRKRNRSVTNIDNATKKARMDENVTSPNENLEYSRDLQDESRQNELHNAYQSNRCIPHQLIRIVYQIDLSVLCSLRMSIYRNKYPSLAFGNPEIDMFNNIVLRYEKQSIHIQVENVDKYYMDSGINYSRLFTKEKRSFSVNNYFNSFVRYLISKHDGLSNNIEYLIVYTNSCLDLTKDNELKKGRFKNFYPFKFDRIEECNILKDFLFTNDNAQGRGFYQFSQDKTTTEELLNRLELLPAMRRKIEGRKRSREFEKEIKKAFLAKLLFAVNQPNREELNRIIKNEIRNGIQDDYIDLHENTLRDLGAQEESKNSTNDISNITYVLNLLMSFLHDMFLYENISFIDFEGRRHDAANNIMFSYKNRISCVKVHNTANNIGYSQLFPCKGRKKKNTVSINEYFTYFVEELNKDKDIEHLIIYTNADLDLTEENKLKKRNSTHLCTLKLDSIDIQKKRYKVLRDHSCINQNGLYQFAREETTRENLLNLLKLPPSMEKNKEDGRIFNESEREIKDKFLDKLIFAVNQSSKEELNGNIKKKIEESNVPYNYEELLEIIFRWLESYEFGSITNTIIEKLLKDIKHKRLSYRKNPNKNISDEIKFARSVVGREGTPAFNQFLDFLIKGEGVKHLEVLKKEEIDLANMSSILHVAGANATKAFKDLYGLWFDEQGNKTQYLKTPEKEGISLSRMSSILGGAGTNAAKTFQDLFHLWFNEQENKPQYLKSLKQEGINLTNISSILSGAGANAANAFKELYDLWFDEQGNKTRYLKTLEKEGINLTSISGILNLAGANAARAFKDLFDLWYNKEGSKPQYLKTLKKEGVNLTNISSILSGAGANAAQVFEGLYDLWFNEHQNKTRYLRTLEKEGVNLTNVSSILNGAGSNAVKAFKDIYDSWFDAKGNKTKHLKHFIENEDTQINFTLHNLSGILSKAGGQARDAFEKYHSVCFSNKGERSELLDNFYNAGFRPGNISSILCGTGARACLVLKRLHNICFINEGKRSKLLDNFYNAGFRPCDLCGLLSGAADSLEKFHNFCFVDETKKYFNHLLIEKKGFTPKNLSKVLHGAGANVCIVFKDFHDVCFDETGDTVQLLDDFYYAGFSPSDLSNILSMAGNNAASLFKKLHELCFNKENYLKHFLAEIKLFTPKSLSRILYGVGLSIYPTIEKLHDLCFYKSGKRTAYLDNLIKNNPQNKILDILYEKVRKAAPAFLDEQNVSEEDDITNAQSNSFDRKEQERNLGNLEQGGFKEIKRKSGRLSLTEVKTSKMIKA